METRRISEARVRRLPRRVIVSLTLSSLRVSPVVASRDGLASRANENLAALSSGRGRDELVSSPFAGAL